ncbi:uncharacterized protein PHALS_13905 [Plasmopara halstedii]|uniref:RxLR-like protein n=1 Tax=Plasmopara halstedii TaxID=4781 RepID=A0A0P1A5G7_PLAHL|nr:uncharacterized protein PHALS_13905 [Plasmopara halstedii]CEG35151.1 hypothetical protein PHALS_13905 [Plasmopara halstedii]|eukprot:XP_024571520.1 hypothetical protein PHALS_13905 [Plasmopara halstedii]
MVTFVFQVTVFGPLLSLVAATNDTVSLIAATNDTVSLMAATNDTVSVQSVPSSSSVSTNAKHGVSDEDRMQYFHFTNSLDAILDQVWHETELQPQKVYDDILSNREGENILESTELKTLADKMESYHLLNLDSNFQVARMIQQSHGDGELSRLVGQNLLPKHGDKVTQMTNVASSNAKRFERGLYFHWLKNGDNVDRVVNRFIESHYLPLDDLEKSAKFLFDENVYQVLINFGALQMNDVYRLESEREVVLALVKRFGLSKTAQMIEIAKTQDSAIRNMDVLFVLLGFSEVQLAGVLRQFLLDTPVNAKVTIFEMPQMFFLENYVHFIATRTLQDSDKLLINALARCYGRSDAARYVQKAINDAVGNLIVARYLNVLNIAPKENNLASLTALRLSIFQHWSDHERFESMTNLLHKDRPSVVNIKPIVGYGFKPDTAAFLDKQLKEAFDAALLLKLLK